MFLEEELGACQEQIGVMRIDRARDRETNRTIMLIERSLLETAEKKGFTRVQRDVDFKMTPYMIREHNRPKQGYTRNFYIPLTKELPAADAQIQLDAKLAILSSFGMFADHPPRLKIPLISRESGTHRGRAFVTFARETDTDVIALARILLHDTRLFTGEDDHELMKCYWAKERPVRSSSSSPPRKNWNGSKKSRKAAPVKKGLTKVGRKHIVIKGPLKPIPPNENRWKQSHSTPPSESLPPSDST